MRFLNALGLAQGSTVALEGAPVYLCDAPMSVHHHAEQVLEELARLLTERGCTVERRLLVDEYSCEDRGYREDYEAICRVSYTSVMLESELVSPARALLELIPEKVLHRGGLSGQLVKLVAGQGNADREQPLLIKNSGMPACALLDAAFQRSKVCDVNIVVHPEQLQIGEEVADFRAQQDSVLEVLRAVRTPTVRHSKLPWTWVHVWLSPDGDISSITCTRNKGQNIKQVNLPTS